MKLMKKWTASDASVNASTLKCWINVPLRSECGLLRACRRASEDSPKERMSFENRSSQPNSNHTSRMNDGGLTTEDGSILMNLEWRNTALVVVDLDTLRRAEDLVASCELCAADLAEIPFDHAVDCVTGCDPGSADYVLVEPGVCPSCLGTLQVAYWRWYVSKTEGRKVYIRPGTLVTLTEDE
jgi:hypothetical protein